MVLHQCSAFGGIEQQHGCWHRPYFAETFAIPMFMIEILGAGWDCFKVLIDFMVLIKSIN